MGLPDVALAGLFDLVGGVGQGLMAPEQQQRQSFGGAAPAAAAAFQNNWNVLNSMNRSALGSPVNVPRTPNVFAGMQQQDFRLPGSGQSIGLGPSNRILNNGVTSVWERAQNRGNFLGQAGGGVPDFFAGGGLPGAGGYPNPGGPTTEPGAIGGGGGTEGIPPYKDESMGGGGGGRPAVGMGAYDQRYVPEEWRPMQGLASFQTMPGQVKQVPGPPGQPMPAIVHGGEMIGRPAGQPMQGGGGLPAPQQPPRPMTPGATMPNVNQPVASAPTGMPTQQQQSNDEQYVAAASLLGHLGAI